MISRKKHEDSESESSELHAEAPVPTTTGLLSSLTKAVTTIAVDVRQGWGAFDEDAQEEKLRRRSSQAAVLSKPSTSNPLGAIQASSDWTVFEDLDVDEEGDNVASSDESEGGIVDDDDVDFDADVGDGGDQDAEVQSGGSVAASDDSDETEEIGSTGVDPMFEDDDDDDDDDDFDDDDDDDEDYEGETVVLEEEVAFPTPPGNAGDDGGDRDAEVQSGGSAAASGGSGETGEVGSTGVDPMFEDGNDDAFDDEDDDDDDDFDDDDDDDEDYEGENVVLEEEVAFPTPPGNAGGVENGNEGADVMGSDSSAPDGTPEDLVEDVGPMSADVPTSEATPAELIDEISSARDEARARLDADVDALLERLRDLPASQRQLELAMAFHANSSLEQHLDRRQRHAQAIISVKTGKASDMAFNSGMAFVNSSAARSMQRFRLGMAKFQTPRCESVLSACVDDSTRMHVIGKCLDVVRKAQRDNKSATTPLFAVKQATSVKENRAQIASTNRAIGHLSKAVGRMAFARPIGCGYTGGGGDSDDRDYYDDDDDRSTGRTSKFKGSIRESSDDRSRVITQEEADRMNLDIDDEGRLNVGSVDNDRGEVAIFMEQHMKAIIRAGVFFYRGDFSNRDNASAALDNINDDVIDVLAREDLLTLVDDGKQLSNGEAGDGRGNVSGTAKLSAVALRSRETLAAKRARDILDEHNQMAIAEMERVLGGESVIITRLIDDRQRAEGVSFYARENGDVIGDAKVGSGNTHNNGNVADRLNSSGVIQLFGFALGSLDVARSAWKVHTDSELRLWRLLASGGESAAFEAAASAAIAAAYQFGLQIDMSSATWLSARVDTYDEALYVANTDPKCTPRCPPKRPCEPVPVCKPKPACAKVVHVHHHHYHTVPVCRAPNPCAVEEDSDDDDCDEQLAAPACPAVEKTHCKKKHKKKQLCAPKERHFYWVPCKRKPKCKKACSRIAPLGVLPIGCATCGGAKKDGGRGAAFRDSNPRDEEFQLENARVLLRTVVASSRAIRVPLERVEHGRSVARAIISRLDPAQPDQLHSLSTLTLNGLVWLYKALKCNCSAKALDLADLIAARLRVLANDPFAQRAKIGESVSEGRSGKAFAAEVRNWIVAGPSAERRSNRFAWIERAAPTMFPADIVYPIELADVLFGMLWQVSASFDLFDDVLGNETRGKQGDAAEANAIAGEWDTAYNRMLADESRSFDAKKVLVDNGEGALLGSPTPTKSKKPSPAKIEKAQTSSRKPAKTPKPKTKKVSSNIQDMFGDGDMDFMGMSNKSSSSSSSKPSTYTAPPTPIRELSIEELLGE